MTEKKIINLLKNNKIKITKNRIEILKCLSDTSHFHSVNEIIEHSKLINKKSVYNNIKLLVSKGIIDSISFGGISKYAINDHFQNKHNLAHIIDNENIMHLEIDNKVIQSLKDAVHKKGYESKSISIFINVKK